MNNYMKTIISGLKQWVSSQKSDWNQSDDSATNYVKNRTHYTDVKKVVVLDEATFSINDYSTLHLSTPIQIGQKYIVNFNGLLYNCIAYNAQGLDGYTFIGNKVTVIGEDTGEPFTVGGVGTEAQLMILNGETCTLSIYTEQEEVKKLDEKYLPDGLALKKDVYTKNEVYTKDEVYNKDEVYTRDEVYNKYEVYNRNEVYDRNSVYTKSETSNLLSGKVSTSRKINGKLLNKDITLTAEDVNTYEKDEIYRNDTIIEKVITWDGNIENKTHINISSFNFYKVSDFTVEKQSLQSITMIGSNRVYGYEISGVTDCVVFGFGTTTGIVSWGIIVNKPGTYNVTLSGTAAYTIIAEEPGVYFTRNNSGDVYTAELRMTLLNTQSGIYINSVNGDKTIVAVDENGTLTTENTDGTITEMATKPYVDNMELITIEDIDTICGGSIQAASEVKY